MSDVMRERGAVISSAAQMLGSGNVNLDTMPQLILRIINEEMWRQRAIPQLGWKLSREFVSFKDFVTGKPLDGLDTTVQMLKDVCRRDIRAQEAIDGQLKKDGQPGQRTDLCNIVTEVKNYPEGNSQAKALRRLRKDRPDLLKRVLLPKDDKRHLSAHKAAVEAGFRKPTFSVRADDPKRAARILHEHYKDRPEQFNLLIEHLQEEARSGSDLAGQE